MSNDCCKTGFKWNGTPVGYEGTLDKNKAYITGTNKEAAVLLVADLFGWTFTNARLLADHFAKEANCTCYVVDFFDGEVIPADDLSAAIENPELRPDVDINAFVGRHSKAIREPEIFACAKALRSEYPKVGAIGYCYGGWACFRLAAKGNNLVDCITVAHPSLVEKSEIDALAVPTQVIAPEIDPLFTPELKEHFHKTAPGLGIPYRYDFYPGLVHGFAAKGDPGNKAQKDGLEKAKNAAVSWFNEYLH